VGAACIAMAREETQAILRQRGAAPVLRGGPPAPATDMTAAAVG
jgi:hypothetical protein